MALLKLVKQLASYSLPSLFVYLFRSLAPWVHLLLLPYILLHFAVYAINFWHGDCNFFLSLPVRLNHRLPLHSCAKTPPRFPPQNSGLPGQLTCPYLLWLGFSYMASWSCCSDFSSPYFSPFIWEAKNKNKNSDSFQVLIHRNLGLSCSATFFQVLSLGRLHPSDP